MWDNIKTFVTKTYDLLVFNLIILSDYFKYSFSDCDTYNTQSDKFKLITFNLRREVFGDGENRWHFRKEKVIDYIKSERPHIVCSQEVMPHMFKFINYKLGNIYAHYSVDNYLGCRLNMSINPWSEGNTIIYDKTKYEVIDKGRFWLSDKPKLPSSTWENKTLRTCVYLGLKDKNDKLIYVFNTHFDHISPEARKKSAELVAEHIKQIAVNATVYLCGDFNAVINSDEMVPLNILLDNTYNHNKNKTFNCLKKSRTKTLDAIYYKFDEEYQIEIPYLKLSDHSPVIIYNK